MEELEVKLLNRPIDQDTRIKSEKIDIKDDFLFLFEESFWDGIYIKSVILLNEQFSDNSKDNIEMIINRYFAGVVNKKATYSVKGEYIFYNYDFKVA